MGRKIRFWLTGIFLLATLVTASLYFKAGREFHSDQAIQKLADELKTNVVQFLQANKSSVNHFKEQLGSVSRKRLTERFLDQYAVQYLKNNPDMYGIIVYTRHFHFLFARGENTWVATYDTVLTDTLTNWVRLDRSLRVIGRWTDTYNYFIDNRSLGKSYKNVNASERNTLWHVLLNKGANHNDFLLSESKAVLQDKTPATFAFVYNLHLKKKSLLAFASVRHPYVGLITPGKKLILPVSAPDSALVTVEKSPVARQIGRLLDDWEKSSVGEGHSYLFLKDGKRYWMHVALLPSGLGMRAVSIAVAEEELKNLQLLQSRLYGYASLIFGVLALLGIFSLRKKQNSGLPHENEISSEEITGIIARGESENIEFKSSLRWDYREQKVNPVLEMVILKSIAAFANGKGGTLLIGVNDDGEILGLEPDFQTLKKKDADGFELHLRRLIKNQFGISFTTAHLQIGFPEIEGKIICVIQIAPAHHPLYLKTKNKNGNETEKFYVRMGNASQEISSLREIQQYIKNRFE